jgi:hypothetical protein
MKPDPSRAFAVIPDGQWKGPVVAALKAMGKGEARPDQQVSAMNFIIESLAGTYDLSFRPEEKGGARETDFAEGRRFVGLQLRRVISTPFETLTGRPTSGERAE